MNLLDTAIVAQIPRVDKQVAVRDVGILLGMGVGDAHDANRPDARRRQAGRPSQTQECLVNGIKESSERRGEEIVRKWSTMEWRGHFVAGYEKKGR